MMMPVEDEASLGSKYPITVTCPLWGLGITYQEPVQLHKH